jgi:endonuclease-3 related protein
MEMLAGSTPPPRTGGKFERAVRLLLDRNRMNRVSGPVWEALVEQGLGEPEALAEAAPAEILDVLEPVTGRRGQRIIAPLRRLAQWWVETAPDEEQPEAVAARDTLKAIRGIGASTAAWITLEALDRPFLPIDRATYRILARHGWLDREATSEEIDEVSTLLGSGDADLARQMTRGFQIVAQRWCHMRHADCEACPLRPLLPPDAPYAIDEEAWSGLSEED